MNTQLKIEFNEDAKTKNAEISAHVQAVQKESPRNNPNKGCGSQSISTFFDESRLAYYGSDWFKLLFPMLNY